MLFNSYSFILLFLPATALAFHLIRRAGWTRGAFAALTLASLIFYGWWSLRGLGLLLVLIACNYGFARLVIADRLRAPRRAKLALTVALVFNLAVLGYFKYANFFVGSIADLTGAPLRIASVALPLGISFFTFQKIALLVDAYKGRITQLNWLDYSLFVAFFPQLIAGPIVHHSEVMPQFRAARPVGWNEIAQGLAIFTIGLAKKVLIADHVAHYATPVFSAAAAARPLSFLEGWVGALAYTLQLYFDFSGYSEMAIGAALLFGIRLPLNFASPYKAGSIIEFWRRWHMTLSRFLRDYLYIPLGGNRRGPGRRYVNLMITMALGGLWHGAGWTFVLWGVLHGAYLTVNHAWNAWAVARPLRLLGTWVGGPLTFLAVVFGWVLFRAESFGAAERMIQAMVQPAMPGGPAPLVDLRAAALVIAPLLAWVFLGPNTQQLARYDPSPQAQSPRPEGRSGRWRLARAAGLGLVFAAAFLSLSKVTEFLYFQF